MFAQKAVLMGVPSVAGMASAVDVTTAGVVATVVKDAVPKGAMTHVRMDVPKAARMDVLKIVTTAAATVRGASVGSATQKRALKVYARSARNVRQARCVVKRRATTAGQTRQSVVMGNNAAIALKTVSLANRALKVRAVSAPVASGESVQNAVTARHAMPQSRILRCPTRPPWQLPCVRAMAELNPCRIAPPRTLAAMKAAVSAVNAMVVATSAVVSAAKPTTQTLKKKAHSVLKQRLQWLRQRSRHCHR